MYKTPHSVIRRRLAGGLHWFPCNICKIKFPVNELTLDHVIQKRRGGADEWSNYQLLCRVCHIRKDFSVWLWFKWQFTLLVRWLKKPSWQSLKKNFGNSVRELSDYVTAILATPADVGGLRVPTGTLATLSLPRQAVRSSGTTSKTSARSATTAISTSGRTAPSTTDEWSPKRAKSSLTVSLPLKLKLSKRTGSGLKAR